MSVDVVECEKNRFRIDRHLMLKAGAGCVIIGQGSLALACIAVLKEHGAEISAIISGDDNLLQFAIREAIPNARSPKQLPHLLNNSACDFIFSIVNPFILDANILSLAKIAAINYHDSPLPRYAGTHATAWALMAGEATHAISWHLMEARVDAGDILQQECVAIDNHETSLTLNLKCQDAALRAFKTLIDDLQTANVKPKQQASAVRSFFPLHQRPQAGAILCWDKTAEELSALVRSLDFGIFHNPLALPKLQIGNQFIIVGELTILETNAYWAAPGTLLNCAYGLMSIKTATNDVALNSLRTLDGTPLSVSALASIFSLEVGQQLPIPTQSISSTLMNLCSQYAPYESFWVNILQQEQYPTGLAYVTDTGVNQASTKTANYSLDISSNLLVIPDNSFTKSDWLLSVFAIYMARINGDCDLNIGLRNTRLHNDIKELETFFANTLPLQLSLNLESTVEQVAAQVSQARSLLEKNGTYARDMVMRNPSLRNLSRFPSMQRWPVVVSVGNEIQNNLDGALLHLTIATDGTRCTWTYSAEHISSALIERMSTQFLTLLTHSVIQKSAKIGCLPLLNDDEKQRVLHDWNATAVNYPQQGCMHELFELNARKNPTATALIFENQSLTYQDLNEKANQLAQYLLALPIQPGAFIGLCMDRSMEMVVGLLAIFKAGAAYVPLDPSYPASRLEYMLNDSAVNIILTSTALALELNKNNQYKTICLDEVAVTKKIAQQSKHNIDKAVANLSANTLAYIIYTSGSTGKPKGTLIRHTGLYNLALAQIDMFAVKPNSRVLQFASISFDAAISECAMALCAGAALVIIKKEVTQSAEKLNAIVKEAVITHVTLPPVLLPLMNLQDWKSVETLAVAGEACPQIQADKWSLGRRFINAYGPTETTVCASMGLYRPSEAVLHIGNPINNTQLYVVNDFNQLQPIGVAGELLVGGVGLAVGYLNQPELNAAKFVYNDFPDIGVTRVYKTGDLVRWLDDGNIEFLGRIDHQIKIRGFRVELGEIENCLLQHPIVAEVVVIARGADIHNKTLAAYIVKKSHSPLDSLEEKNVQEHIESIFQHLHAHLPDYMVPGSVTFLPRIPLTPNGKVDRKALPEPDVSTTKQYEYVEPQTDLERLFCHVWQNILSVPRVGITDNFFQLGGNSILVIHIVAELGLAGVKLAPEKIYEAPTISELLKFATCFQAIEKLTDTTTDSYALVTGKAPVLPNILNMLSTWVTSHWNVSHIWEVLIPYTADTLHQAAVAVVNHHDGLRSLWRKENDEWHQYFQSPDEMLPWWQIVDLSDFSADAASKEVERLCSEAQFSLDLATTLFKVIYFDFGPGRNSRLFFLFHHYLIDNYSTDIFLDDFERLCDLLHAGQPIYLPPKTTSIKALAEAYERYAFHPDLDKDLAFWLTKPWHKYQSLPKEPNPAELTVQADQCTLTGALTEEETRLLDAIPRKENVSLLDVSLTALLLAYAEWSGSKVLFMSVTNHGRSSLAHEPVDLSRTVGLLPMQPGVFFELPERASLKETVYAIKRQYDELRGKEANFIILRTRHPSPDVREKMLQLPEPLLNLNVFGFHAQPEINGFDIAPEYPGPDIPPASTENSYAFQPYSVIGYYSPGILSVKWTYASSMYAEKTIQNLLTMNMKALRALIDCLQ
jgi:amino acid adenylation domain-containing protein